jgi:two-component system chemotaxis response regulator CheB
MAVSPSRDTETQTQRISNPELVLIGGSAGSLTAIREIVSAFPANMPAAVIVVVHMSPRGKSVLPTLLEREGGLPARQLNDGDKLEPANIYVAVPDRHVVVAEGHVHLSRGPKEGLHRPSINVTFRSAAMAYGPRAIGILLSGMLDDGAAGLWEIANHGGITIIQDPAEAPYPSMPLNALRDAKIDFTLRVGEIGRVINELVRGNSVPKKPEMHLDHGNEETFSGFTCPECRGPLYLMRRTGPTEFRCRVGHVMSLGTLLEEGTSTQERKLYEAIVALQEGADVAEFAAKRASGLESDQFREEAQKLRDYAEAIKQIIERRPMPKLS